MTEQEYLEKQIKAAQEAYYVHSSPIMEDSEFDLLWDELREKYPDSSLLNEVGNDSISGWPKAQHVLVMGSQNKVTTEQELENWMRLNKVQFPLLVQHKLDGLSLELIYKKGILDSAITRGDGVVGDLVTQNAVKVEGIPEIIEDKAEIRAIRGEVCMRVSVFEQEYAENYANPRNLSSGILKSKDGANCSDLVFLAYDMNCDEIPFIKTYGDIEKYLFKLGFLTPYGRGCEDIEQFKRYVLSTQGKRSILPLQIDGLVLKSRDIDHEDRKEYRPKKQIAWKFPPEEKATELTSVEWQVAGETLTPVAVLNPVRIDGSTVSRASLVNVAEIERLGLHIGDTVIVAKRGDIIPKIERVKHKATIRTPIVPPNSCPVCGMHTEMDESSRVLCTYPKCSAKNEQRLRKWIEKTGILGFGPELIRRLMRQGVTEISDLYAPDLFSKAVDSTHLKKATMKAFHALYAVKELPLEKFIAGFNIRGFGERQTKKLVNAGHDTLEKIFQLDLSDFDAIEGLGSKTYFMLVRYLGELKPEMLKVREFVKITPPVEKKETEGVSGKTFVITGKLQSGTRAEIQAKIEMHGGKAGSSVNSKTDYLVNNDIKSTTGKNKKAKELGVPIISEADLLEMIGD